MSFPQEKVNLPLLPSLSDEESLGEIANANVVLGQPPSWVDDDEESSYHGPMDEDEEEDDNSSAWEDPHTDMLFFDGPWFLPYTNCWYNLIWVAPYGWKELKKQLVPMSPLARLDFLYCQLLKFYTHEQLAQNIGTHWGNLLRTLNKEPADTGYYFSLYPNLKE